MAKDSDEKRRAQLRAASHRYKAKNRAKLAAFAREYRRRPKAKKRIAEYMRRYGALPEVRKRKAEHNKKYQARPEVRAKRAAKKAEKRRAADPAWLKQQVAANRARILARQQTIAGRARPETCDICGDSSASRSLHFDHCHKHGHFRGWLCNRCNIVLGHVGDSVALLNKLIAYLQQTTPTAQCGANAPGGGT